MGDLTDGTTGTDLSTDLNNGTMEADLSTATANGIGEPDTPPTPSVDANPQPPQPLTNVHSQPSWNAQKQYIQLEQETGQTIMCHLLYLALRIISLVSQLNNPCLNLPAHLC